MKTQIKIAALALGVLLAAHVKAQDFQPAKGIETPTYLAKVNVNESASKLRVFVAKKEGNKSGLEINLKDANGHEIYYDKLGKNENQSVITLNMEQLEDGFYTLEMSDKFGKQTKTFVKKTDVIAVRTEKYLIAINEIPKKNL